jgi:hypothetical protein
MTTTVRSCHATGTIGFCSRYSTEQTTIAQGGGNHICRPFPFARQLTTKILIQLVTPAQPSIARHIGQQSQEAFSERAFRSRNNEGMLNASFDSWVEIHMLCFECQYKYSRRCKDQHWVATKNLQYYSSNCYVGTSDTCGCCFSAE